jgi:hypothetical protein
MFETVTKKIDFVSSKKKERKSTLCALLSTPHDHMQVYYVELHLIAGSLLYEWGLARIGDSELIYAHFTKKKEMRS